MKLDLLKTYYTVGLDMQCRRVLCAVKVMETFPPDEHGRDCVIRSDGINILFDSNTLYSQPEEIRL